MSTEKVEGISIIDIDKTLKTKNPGLYRWLPRFVINYLKRVIHQDEYNVYITGHSHESGIEFVHSSLEFTKVKYELRGIENLPANGRFVFAANHPLGGVDGLAFISSMHKHYGDCKVIVNDLLMNLKNLGSFFIGVNKHGSNTKDSIIQFDNTMAGDLPVLVFPAGLISRKINGVITDLEWKKTFLHKAIQHKRDIIPVHISGRVSNFFYRLYTFRKFFGIKANIEMLYLPDETLKQRGKTITLTFGKPIPYNSFDNSLNHTQWAQKIKELVYQLPQNYSSK